jgi:hypothetical protein
MSVPSPRSEMDYGDHEWLLCFNQVHLGNHNSLSLVRSRCVFVHLLLSLQVVVFKDTGAQTARFFDVRFSARPHGVGQLDLWVSVAGDE